MTSRTGPGRTSPPKANRASPSDRRARARRGAAGVRAGFTLFEVLLVLLLLGLLATAGYMTLSPLQDHARFGEGVRRFEALLRMARADAAGNGQHVRLAPEQTEDAEETVRVRILVEPDPISEPGQFTRYRCTWGTFRPRGLVRLTRCSLLAADAYRQMALDRGGDETSDAAPLAPVTFYPNGSSDSAVFELAPIDQYDPRRAVILLDGINGTITTRMLYEDELEEYYEQAGLGDQGT